MSLEDKVAELVETNEAMFRTCNDVEGRMRRLEERYVELETLSQRINDIINFQETLSLKYRRIASAIESIAFEMVPPTKDEVKQSVEINLHHDLMERRREIDK
jgi:hypothetical protein